MLTHGKQGYGMANFIFRSQVIAKTLFIYVFYLPGLILHEGSHAIAAIITGSKIISIKLIPSIEFAQNDKSYKVVYGYVNSIARLRAAYMVIGLAPFFLWLIPIFIMKSHHWISIEPFGIDFKEMLQFRNVWFFILLVQILWAGNPSSQDWKVFFYGLFSISTILIVSAILSIYVYFPTVYTFLFELI